MNLFKKTSPVGDKKTGKISISLVLGAITTCGLWGISTPIIKLGYKNINSAHIPSLLLWVGIQFAIAGILTGLFGGITEKKFPVPQKKNIIGIGLISLLQTVLQYVCTYIGLQNTTAVKGAILKSTDVFFIIIIAGLIFKQEKLTVKKLTACIIGFAGIVLVNLNGLSFDFNLTGDGIVVLGMVFYSLAVVLTKYFAKNENPFTLCGYQMTFGGIIMLIIGLIGNGTMNYRGMLPIILILSVLYAVSYTVWTLLLKKYPASKVSVFSFTTPIFGVVFSSLILNEKSNIPIVNLIISLTLVCLGIIMQSKSEN